MSMSDREERVNLDYSQKKERIVLSGKEHNRLSYQRKICERRRRRRHEYFL